MNAVDAEPMLGWSRQHSTGVSSCEEEHLLLSPAIAQGPHHMALPMCEKIRPAAADNRLPSEQADSF